MPLFSPWQKSSFLMAGLILHNSCLFFPRYRVEEDQGIRLLRPENPDQRSHLNRLKCVSKTDRVDSDKTVGMVQLNCGHKNR